MAKRGFAMGAQQWASIELYVGKKSAGHAIFDLPILLREEDHYKKAMFFLHHPEKPDYPAAANYFRKHAEDLLSGSLFTHEIRDDDDSTIPGYQLSKLLNSGIRFLKKVNISATPLLQLHGALPSLLHPLSHFNLSSPIYRKELQAVQDLLPQIRNLLNDVKLFCNPKFHHGHSLKVNIVISPSLTHRYIIKPLEMIYLIDIPGHSKRFSIGKCYCSRMCQVDQHGVESNGKSLSVNLPDFQYESIEDCYNRLFAFNQNTHTHLVKSTPYTNDFSVHIDGNEILLNTILL
jgi:hypothetical protein